MSIDSWLAEPYCFAGDEIGRYWGLPTTIRGNLLLRLKTSELFAVVDQNQGRHGVPRRQILAWRLPQGPEIRLRRFCYILVKGLQDHRNLRTKADL